MPNKSVTIFFSKPFVLSNLLFLLLLHLWFGDSVLLCCPSLEPGNDMYPRMSWKLVLPQSHKDKGYSLRHHAPLCFSVFWEVAYFWEQFKYYTSYCSS